MWRGEMRLYPFLLIIKFPWPFVMILRAVTYIARKRHEPVRQSSRDAECDSETGLSASNWQQCKRQLHAINCCSCTTQVRWLLTSPAWLPPIPVAARNRKGHRSAAMPLDKFLCLFAVEFYQASALEEHRTKKRYTFLYTNSAFNLLNAVCCSTPLL